MALSIAAPVWPPPIPAADSAGKAAAVAPAPVLGLAAIGAGALVAGTLDDIKEYMHAPKSPTMNGHVDPATQAGDTAVAVK